VHQLVCNKHRKSQGLDSPPRGTIAQIWLPLVPPRNVHSSSVSAIVELQSERLPHTPFKGDLQIVEPSPLTSHTFPLRQVLSVKHSSFKSVCNSVALAGLRVKLGMIKGSKLTSPRNYSTYLIAIGTSL
jgi:hypothetical protein